MEYNYMKEEFTNEWTRYQIVIPDDDYDEDDEIDERIAVAEKKKRQHIDRGSFFGI